MLNLTQAIQEVIIETEDVIITTGPFHIHTKFCSLKLILTLSLQYSCGVWRQEKVLS